VYKRQSIPGRIESKNKIKNMTLKWNLERNLMKNKVDWQFTTNDARTKLKRLYPKF